MPIDNPAGLLLRRQRPDDARHPERNRDQHPRLACQHPGQPRVRRPGAPVADDRHGAGDQKAPKIALAHLRYLAKPRLAPGRVLAWREPGCKVAPAPETLHRRRKGLESHRGNRPGTVGPLPRLRAQQRGAPCSGCRSARRNRRSARAEHRPARKPAPQARVLNRQGKPTGMTCGATIPNSAR